MKKIALAGVVLGLSTIAPAAARAQSCPPGALLCADIRIGTQQPPPVMVQQPVYVQPPAPPRVLIVPPPPRVYVQQPPVVVYQQRPVFVPPPPLVYTQTVYTQQTVQTNVTQQPPARRNTYFGLQGQFATSFFGGHGTAMFGGGTGFRIRGTGHFGFELGLNVFGGQDYNGDRRLEVPLSASALVIFNPQHAFQVYGVAGLNASFSRVSYSFDNSQMWRNYASSAEYTHIGGHIGLGFERQINQRFSLFLDARVFIRQRVDGDAASNPEFARITPDGFLQTTNTSAGALLNAGAVVYF